MSVSFLDSMARPASAGATSAMGTLGAGPSVRVVQVAGLLSVWGTSSNGDRRALPGSYTWETTTASTHDLPSAVMVGNVPRRTEITSAGIAELRRLGGLTWEQVAELFGVSRRSVHFWASGKPMTVEHEQQLGRILDVLRGAGGSADTVRARLLASDERVLQLLANGAYSAASDALGTGTSYIALGRTPLSAAAADARRPLSPELLAASEESVVVTPAVRGRVVRTRRSQDP